MSTWNLENDAMHYDERGFWEYDTPRRVDGTTRNEILENIGKAMGERVIHDESIFGGFRFRSAVNRRVFGYVQFWN